MFECNVFHPKSVNLGLFNLVINYHACGVLYKIIAYFEEIDTLMQFYRDSLFPQ